MDNSNIVYEYKDISEIKDFIKTEYENTECPYSKAILNYTDFDTPIKILVALRDHTVLGFGLVEERDLSHLNILYIKESERRKGIAKSIVNNLNISKLGCISGNKKALNFYKSLGFNTTFHGKYMNILERN